jgi:probable rRNA maturation factor
MRKTRPDERRARRARLRTGPARQRPERLAVDVSVDGLRTPVDTRGLADLARLVLRAEKARDAMISIAFVSPTTIARLNERYLGHTGPTDVIAFALNDRVSPPAVALGDVYICPAVARANARRFGVSMRNEIERLVVHGTLHVLGHEHETAAREHSPMWATQERLLRAWRRRAS